VAACERVVLAYRPSGFRELGGIRSVANLVVTHWARQTPERPLATLQTQPDPAGVLEGTQAIRRLRRADRLILLGCDSPWAYGLALRARLLPPHRSVHWLPSFHDPNFVRHPRLARLAGWVLRRLQVLGVNVHAQTPHEQTLLQAGRCHLSSHAMPKTVLQRLQHSQNTLALAHRPVDLLFFGRPTAQKGWPRFLELCQRSGLKAAAIVPTPPPNWTGLGQGPELWLAPASSDLPALLSSAKVVLIPSDYESFGLAQLEALACGCLVPILGRWPLWDDFPLLRWQRCGLVEMEQRCQRLCGSERLRSRLVRQQRQHVLGHPILQVPALPGA
jgi:glycosyltransferase involved in cell wall biosynthesis